MSNGLLAGRVVRRFKHAGFATLLVCGLAAAFGAPLDAAERQEPTADPAIAEGIALVQEGRVEEALSHFDRLAAGGDAEAMYHLGAIHHSGLTGEPNIEKAIAWYARAAGGGVPEAKLALGSIYFNGNGVAKNFGLALRYFGEAADAGLISAQYNLALMHAAGLAHSKEYGAEKDRQHAYKWFTIVLAQLDEGDERAAVEEGFTVLKQEMTYEEMAEGRVMADEWLSAHAIGAHAIGKDAQ